MLHQYFILSIYEDMFEHPPNILWVTTKKSIYIYLTKFGQNTDFLTFWLVLAGTWVSAGLGRYWLVSVGRQISKNR
jgi:hypothetical protein